LVKAGVIDDAAFAESRARSLTRTGRSARAVAAHLGARGVERDVVRAALGDDPETQLAACLALTRRRRIGAFRRAEMEPDVPREMGMLARAGFEHEIARKALEMDPETAEALVIGLKQA
jgi:regulatory protein